MQPLCLGRSMGVTCQWVWRGRAFSETVGSYKRALPLLEGYGWGGKGCKPTWPQAVQDIEDRKQQLEQARVELKQKKEYEVRGEG